MRSHFLVRVAVSAFLMLTWLTATNHCALGGMRTTEGEAEQPHCHGGNSSTKGKSGTPRCECCRSIHATPSSSDPLIRHDTATFVSFEFPRMNETMSMAQPDERAFFLDHGPPDILSFAELVLQRSILSHAPPDISVTA